MSRSVGAVDAVHALLPEEAALLVGLLTQLGDVWFLFGVTVVAYWLRPSDRDRVAVVLGLALATAAMLEALKALFGLPRPPTPLATAEVYPPLLRGLFEATATAGGQGFPSGHATLSAVVWLGLAGAIRIGDPRRRGTVAIGLIAAIALSRVALGVHFLVDVVAGTLLGLAMLAGVAWAMQLSPIDHPTTTFGLSVVIGAAGVLLTATTLDVGASFSPPAHDSVLALCATMGALAGWQALRMRATGTQDPVTPEQAPPAERRRRPVRAVVATLLVLGLVALTAAGILVGEGTAVVAGGAGLGVAVAVALPVIVPDFDATVAGYVPQWVHVETAGGTE